MGHFCTHSGGPRGNSQRLPSVCSLQGCRFLEQGGLALQSLQLLGLVSDVSGSSPTRGAGNPPCRVSEHGDGQCWSPEGMDRALEYQGSCLWVGCWKQLLRDPAFLSGVSAWILRPLEKELMRIQVRQVHAERKVHRWVGMIQSGSHDAQTHLWGWLWNLALPVSSAPHPLTPRTQGSQSAAVAREASPSDQMWSSTQGDEICGVCGFVWENMCVHECVSVCICVQAYRVELMVGGHSWTMWIERWEGGFPKEHQVSPSWRDAGDPAAQSHRDGVREWPHGLQGCTTLGLPLQEGLPRSQKTLSPGFELETPELISSVPEAGPRLLAACWMRISLSLRRRVFEDTLDVGPATVQALIRIPIC